MRMVMKRGLAKIMALLLVLVACSSALASPANATVSTVGISVGDEVKYGYYSTNMMLVTQINGIKINYANAPEIVRSYAYCVQPDLAAIGSGTYNVSLVNDDDTGKIANMRKMIYYLPGAYGYKRVTKTKWFQTMPEDTKAYTIGHIALAYMYDNCNANTAAFKDTDEDVKDKVKAIVKDLSKLAAPPDDFEVFWIKVSGKQDVFGAFYRTEYGNVAVKLKSASTAISSGNKSYSLAGAEYSLFMDRDCEKIAQTEDGKDAVITIKEDGTSDPIRVETDEYYLRQTRSAPGYALNLAVTMVEINKDETLTNEYECIPKSNEVGMLLQMVVAKNDETALKEGTTLKGAEFTVKYYDGEASGEATRTWVFRTDEEGKVDMSKEAYLVKDKSSPLYMNSLEKVVLPIGTICINQTTASEGYSLDETTYTRRILDKGTIEELDNFVPLTGDDAITAQLFVEEEPVVEDLTVDEGTAGGDPVDNGEPVIEGPTVDEGSADDETTDNGDTPTAGPTVDGGTSGDATVSVIEYTDPAGETQYLEIAGQDVQVLTAEETQKLNAREINTLGTAGVVATENGKGANVVTKAGTKSKKTSEDESGKGDRSHGPKTGDESVSLVLLMAVMILSITEAVVLTVKKKNDRLCAERK